MAGWVRRRPGRTYLAGAPQLVAHRGGAALAPENTMAAFRIAVERWDADMLEMDLRLTRDGHVVVIHDETVDRTTDGQGAVVDFDLADLQRLDAGYHFKDLDGAPSFRGTGVRVPTLREVLEAFPGVWLNVEPKEERAAGPLYELLRGSGHEHRVLVAAGVESNRRPLRGYTGPWGASRRQCGLFWASHRLPGGGPYTPRADIFQVPEFWDGRRILSPGFVREAHRRNMPVQVWTVDDPDTMRRLLSWGVDGIQTDRPDLLAAVLTAGFGRPPAPAARGDS